MPEFDSDQKRDTYVNGLLQEQADNEQHLEAVTAAGGETKAISEHLAAIAVELKRVGVDLKDADVKAKVAEKRPAKPAAETR